MFGKDILQQLVVLWCALVNRPVRDMGSEQILLDDMWDVVGLSLLNPLRLQRVIRVLQKVQSWLIEVLFPPDMKTHRHNTGLTLVLASVMTMQGLLQTSLNCGKTWARRIFHVMTGPLRQLLLQPSLDHHVVFATVTLLRQCLETTGVNDEACVYTVFNQHSWYIGKALLRRQNGKLGIVCRIMEHLTSILRVHSQAARSVRAILLRQQPIGEVCFLVLKKGPHDWIKASETVAIRTLRPPGNHGQCKSNRRDARPSRKRRRPPPRFRKRSAQPFWNSSVCMNQVWSILKHKQIRPFGNLAPAWTAQTFTVAYRRKQQHLFSKSGQQGPLSIYSARQGGLLALWICSRHATLDLHLLLKRRQPAVAVLRLARLVELVRGYVRQSNGFRRVDWLLARFNLPSRRHHWFRCFDASDRKRLATIVRLAARSAAKLHGAFLYRWIIERVHFTAGALPRLSDQRNAVQWSKKISIGEIWKQGCFEWEHWRQGAEVKKIPGNWAIPDRQVALANKSGQNRELKAWLLTNRFPRRVSRVGTKAWEKPANSAPDVVPEEEARYIAALVSKQDEVLLQDDKDKKSTWTMPFACLATTLVCLVLLDSQWEPTSMSLEQLSILVHGVSLFALPAALRRGPLPQGSFAPYMYPFVKAKCFAASGGHTCKKKNHSCLRKVVSFFRAPWRGAWRLAGRAIQVLIRVTGPGFSVWKLKQVVPIFQQKMAGLRSSPCPQMCVCCKGPKHATTLLVADAAQMYEQVNSNLVLQAFDAKVEQLRHKYGVVSITVSRQRPIRGWPGGSEHTRSRGLVVLTVYQLRRMLQGSCMLNFASVGNLVVRAKGLVIGGLLSMIAAVCLLSHEEDNFLESGWMRICGAPQDWEVEELLFGLRYVDDLLLVSKAVCHHCLQAWLANIYSVKFTTNPEEIQQTWTDLVFTINPASGAVTWTAKNPNRLWIQGAGDKTKERFVPFLGRLQCSFGLLRCLMLGRLARLRELELPCGVQLQLLAEELQELILEGYPLHLLRALVHSLPVAHPIFLKLRKAIRNVCKHGPKSQGS